MKDVKIKETKRRIHCANDSELVNYGIVQLKIKIERIQKTVDFFVVKDLEPEMIAGIDFLNKFSIKLKKETGYNEGVLAIRDTLTDGDRLKRIREIYADKIDEPLMKLLIEYKTIFMANKWDIGKTTLTKP